MGILDKLKDKVSEMTGVDGDALVEAAGDVIEAGDNLSEAVDVVREGKHEE
jgi:hypothetical protein